MLNMSSSDKKINSTLLLIIVIYSVIQIFISKPDTLLNDWLSWRQADTQTIAINFLKSGSNIFYPQINWGGAGPGYVEAEFQLYTFLIAQLMKIFGVSEWPGVILSLIFIIITTLILFKTILYVSGNYESALLGSLVFLTSNDGVHLSTAIIPDSLSILFYSVGFYYFIRFTKEEKNSVLIISAIATSLAGLIKPLSLNLGIVQFLILFLSNRNLLKRVSVWISWLLILIIVGSYLFFSYNLYIQYGNTFGVIGGDQKFPTIKGLLVPIHYLKLIYMIVLWGLGPIGSLALIYLLIKRKFSYLEWSMLIANLIVVFVAMRYMVNQGFSPHYYIFMDFWGAFLVSKAYMELSLSIKSESKLKKYRFAVITLIILVFAFHIYHRTHPLGFHFDENVNETGYRLKEIAEPNSLIIVRSIASEKERAEWGNRINNYEDPRIFYITQLRGWVIPYDYKGTERVEEYFRQGAKYFVEPFDKPLDTNLEIWLQNNAIKIHSDEFGRIYKFVKHPEE